MDNNKNQSDFLKNGRIVLEKCLGYSGDFQTVYFEQVIETPIGFSIVYCASRDNEKSYSTSKPQIDRVL